MEIPKIYLSKCKLSWEMSEKREVHLRSNHVNHFHLKVNCRLKVNSKGILIPVRLADRPMAQEYFCNSLSVYNLLLVTIDLYMIRPLNSDEMAQVSYLFIPFCGAKANLLLWSVVISVAVVFRGTD